MKRVFTILLLFAFLNTCAMKKEAERTVIVKTVPGELHWHFEWYVELQNKDGSCRDMLGPFDQTKAIISDRLSEEWTYQDFIKFITIPCIQQYLNHHQEQNARIVIKANIAKNAIGELIAKHLNATIIKK